MNEGASSPVDAVGTELLFENEAVRVWSMRLAPGERSPYHRHLMDYLFVYLTASRLTLKSEPRDTGTTIEFADGYTEYINVGDGIQHQIANASNVPHHQIIVELKPHPGTRARGSHNGRKSGG